MTTQNPQHRSPNPDGFSVIDCTGITLGNADIEGSSVQGQMRPEDVSPGTTPLPIYPTRADLPERPTTAQPQPFLSGDPRQGSDL